MSAKRRAIGRPHGLKWRWMFNSVSVVMIVLVIAIAAYILVTSNNYYSSVRTGLESKARTATDFFSSYITKTYAEYYDSAYSYTENFEDANTIQLQFISTDGTIEVSSYGMGGGTSPGTQDVTDALTTGKIASWTGKNPSTGERIMAVSAPMKYTDGQIIGIMRYVTSMRLVNHEILVNALISVAMGVVALLIVIVMNMYFVRSLVRPVQDVSLAARRIADGSYGIQIDRKYKDEMGEMVTAINNMSLKISEAEKTQTEFISSISHELRTPLTAITGWSETILLDEELAGDNRKGVGIILKEASRLTKMVEELLEFTRMQDGRFTLNVEEIDIAAELEDSIFTYRELLRQDAIELRYEPGDQPLPMIVADPARLRQVFLNILDNAAKYARDGKRIDVSIDADEEYVSIRIRDYGRGVPEDELEHVKMKFYKGSSKERGSGIGLAVCDEIVKYHGGELTLSNAQGGGLLVTVTLPSTL